MTAAPDQMTERLRRYADALRRQGAITTDAVHRAFATVQRHHCVEAFYYRGERYGVPQDSPPPDEVLGIIYSDASLLTIMPSRSDEPASSSSAPTIMGPMLEELDLSPGMRVLEIGAGTGYNAALIATITGAEVVTVEAGDVAAAGAAESIRRLGIDDLVRVVYADGYGGPTAESGRFDRIIVTVGIAGIPPAWFDRLTDDGLILAPIAHGGMHPTMAMRPGKTVYPRLWSDFMTAVGPLRPPEASGRPGAKITGEPGHLPEVFPALETGAYNDLWFYLGANDSRTTRAYLDHPEFDPWGGFCAIVTEDHRAAWVRRDGSVLHTDSALGTEAARFASAWYETGCPTLRRWHAELRPAFAAESLLVPTNWQH
ncbi:protein-L-isoaspartate O-methyltransferase family protein [Allosalinactinospora lopnorensis]|uniref:protein-L-isoaspartate O-methyltransferase family protein n=1 Tax=Allosalinactinospora lopnorensis TaxID=1352348 RepID=UPI0006985982|nr:class I SAM-dependent methyltransferase [Allosalinactinospora lopnorensis]